MKKRRLALGSFAFAWCGPTEMPAMDGGTNHDAGVDAGRTDAGTDAGYDAGPSDAGPSDAGPSDAGGCPCFRTDGGCALPADFPLDGGVPQFFVEEQCYCTPNPQSIVYCYDETPLRCESWACNPGKGADGGGEYGLPDGGLVCYC